MWRIIVTSLLYIVMVEGRAMDLAEGSLWFQDAANSSPELLVRRQPYIRSQRSFQQSIYNPDNDYELLLPRYPSTKRAITMFSRWSPISNIGKQRTPIRSNPNTIPFNQIRDRQHGQPLRWG